MDQSIINFKVYEDSVEYVGMAQATLPDLTALTQSISGAGIAGNVESVILGHFDAMTLGLNFRTVTDQSVKLSEPRRHTIDLRVAQQDEDVVAGKVVVRAVKHILVVIPKSDACVALCGVCLYGAALSKSSWNGVTLFSDFIDQVFSII